MSTIHCASLVAIAFSLFISACGGSGQSSSSIQVQSVPADSSATADAGAVQAYLAALTRDALPGVIAGQNTGHGSQILDAAGLTGYAPLIGALEQQTGEAPGVIGLDYEHDRIFTSAELSAANQVLIEHWQKGGLVTINWSPHNPWLNDESDLDNHPGTWTDTRNAGDNLKDVDLRQLVDPQSSIYLLWRRKLDRVAVALQELQAAGVVVLWRPMQEMNGNWFWWGIATSSNDPAPYVAVWRDMFRYFTEVKGLHNLLWVYSPARGPNGAAEQASIRPAGWLYPGNAYVDVVAGTAYNDTLEIQDYRAYLSFGKPVAMAELGSALGGALGRTGSLDNLLYVTRMHLTYPAVAYWVSWHNWDNGDGTQELKAIVSNRNANDLMHSPQTISRRSVAWKSFR